jgi:hypothetical protein
MVIVVVDPSPQQQQHDETAKRDMFLWFQERVPLKMRMLRQFLYAYVSHDPFCVFLFCHFDSSLLDWRQQTSFDLDDDCVHPMMAVLDISSMRKDLSNTLVELFTGQQFQYVINTVLRSNE